MGDNSNKVNKITILCVSGKKRDRNSFYDAVYNRFGFVESCIYTKLTKSKKIISRIKNEMMSKYWHEFMIFEGLNNNVVQDIGNELDNMIIDIRLNKFSKCIVSKQIQECLELLEKL